MFHGGRAPYGARGLKQTESASISIPAGRRAPYGARGLKHCTTGYSTRKFAVALHTGRVD